MSAQTNKETVRRFIEEVFNKSQLHEFTAQDHINHDPRGQATQGSALNVSAYRTAFPDLHTTVTQILGEGDLVAVQWIATGTHHKPIPHLTAKFALPATGKTATVTGFSLFRFEGSKIAEVWNHWDTHHLLEQISGS